jgi:hypothetical protein
MPAALRRKLSASKTRLNDALVRLDVVRRPLGNLLPMIEDEDHLAEPHDNFHIMLDEENGAPLIPEPGDGGQEVVEQRTVDPGGRLVQKI